MSTRRFFFSLFICVIFFGWSKGNAAPLYSNSHGSNSKTSAAEAAPNDEPYTGLIIDARGLNVPRAMTPAIFDQQRRLIWNARGGEMGRLPEQGAVSYQESVDEAYRDARAGSHPLVVRALGKREPFDSDVVVSDTDAASIQAENEKTHFLDKFNVVFVIGPREEQREGQRYNRSGGGYVDGGSKDYGGSPSRRYRSERRQRDDTTYYYYYWYTPSPYSYSWPPPYRPAPPAYYYYSPHTYLLPSRPVIPVWPRTWSYFSFSPYGLCY